MIHRRTHPNLDVEGCDACRWSSINIGMSALPNRRVAANNHGAWSQQMQTDMAAYKTLRDEGLQPPGIQGAHQRMMHAETDEQVEGRPKLWGQRDEFLTGQVPDMGVKDAPAA